MKLLKYCPDTGVHPEASSEDIIAAFNDLPLPTRMLVLADTAGQANERLLDEGVTPGLATDAYRRLGSRWEREDAEKAKEAAEVEELAQFLINQVYEGDPRNWETSTEYQRDIARLDARALVKGGYRKRADDDRP